MFRRLGFCVAFVAGLGSCGWLSAGPRSELIPEPAAQRHGLTRYWFTQVQMDAGRARVTDVVLDEGTLFVQTDRATVHAIDAETGQTRWAKLVGRPNHPSVTPGPSRDLVVVINGSRLYALNRVNGDLLYETQVGSVPGAGAAVGVKRAFVPMLTGMVMAYRLEPLTDPQKELGKIEKDLTAEEKAARAENRRENLQLSQEFIPPLSCQSVGRATVRPLLMRQTGYEEWLAWPTERGFLYVGQIDRRTEERLDIVYRFTAEAGVAGRPGYMPPDPKSLSDSGTVFVAARDGYVHALQERSGNALWRFSTGEPIEQGPVLIDDRLYVATQFGGMHCLEAKTGKALWWAPQIVQFIAAASQRVYAVDKLGRILVLSARSGMRLDTLPPIDAQHKLINTETDRLYLVSSTGLVQALHEVEQVQPLLHNENRKQAQGPVGAEQKGVEQVQPKPKRPPGEKKPPPKEGEENPFDAPGKDAANPFDDGAKPGPAKVPPPKVAPKPPAPKGGQPGPAGPAENPFG